MNSGNPKPNLLFWDHYLSILKISSIINVIGSIAIVALITTKCSLFDWIRLHSEVSSLCFYLPLICVISVIGLLLVLLLKGSIKTRMVNFLFYANAALTILAYLLSLPKLSGHLATYESALKPLLAAIVLLHIITSVIIYVANKKVMPNYTDS